jgi:hypothetical protein
MNEQQRVVVRQALEALESLFNWKDDPARGQRCVEAITALRKLLEQSEPVQEPVAYCHPEAIQRLRDEPSDWMLIYGRPQHPHKFPLYTTPPAQPATVSNETMQKLREKLESPSYNHALAYQNIREALEIVMRWIDDYCETGPENDFERVEKIAEAALEATPPAQQPTEWVDLTNEEIWSVYTKVDSMQYMEFARAIEVKLREKNGMKP